MTVSTDFPLDLGFDAPLAHSNHGKESFLLLEHWTDAQGIDNSFGLTKDYKEGYTYKQARGKGNLYTSNHVYTLPSVREALQELSDPKKLHPNLVPREQNFWAVVYSVRLAMRGFFFRYRIRHDAGKYYLYIDASKGSGWLDHHVLDIPCPVIETRDDAHQIILQYLDLPLPHDLVLEANQ